MTYDNSCIIIYIDKWLLGIWQKLVAVLYATFMKSTMLLTARIITCNTLLQYEDTSAFGILIIPNVTKKYICPFSLNWPSLPRILLAAVLQGNVMDQPNIHTSNIKSVINLVN